MAATETDSSTDKTQTREARRKRLLI